MRRLTRDASRATLGEEHPNTLTSLNNLATLLQAQGKLAEAEPLLEEALRASRATIGEEHPARATIGDEHLETLTSMVGANPEVTNDWTNESSA